MKHVILLVSLLALLALGVSAGDALLEPLVVMA